MKTLLLITVWCLVVCPGIFAVSRPSYRAAVYEHAVIQPIHLRTVSRSQAVINMKRNLDVYAAQTRIAGRENVDIIVFPEDGIYGVSFNRDTIKPYLEDIPNPREVEWNPCNQSNSVNGSEVQRMLSCMARSNNMYVVANMGDKKSCDPEIDISCNPIDRQYQYNTNVVFNNKGTLVARYHKQHLYLEAQFDTPSVVEKVTFDAPFGKFGVMTCFDVLFKSPAIDLVEELGVQNVVFPTAWMDSLPLLSAIQFHSAFAKLLKINLLVANIHFPLLNFHGSGIYSPKRTESYYYNDNLFSGGKLLIADVKSNPRQHRRHQLVPDLERRQGNIIQLRSESGRRLTAGNERHRHGDDDVASNQFHLSSISRQMVRTEWALLLDDQDNYEYVPLTEKKAKVKICQNEVCCYLDYEMKNTTQDLYALGVFDGLHAIDGLDWYTQVCVLLKCAFTDISSCGRETKVADGYFEYIKLWGSFSTPYVFPEILVSHHGQLKLEHEHWKYRHNRIEFVNTGKEKPLLTAALYGRVYERDNTSHFELD